MDAKQKITEEIEANKNNSYVKVVGEFLLGFLANNSVAAEKLVAKDKSILKSLDAMKEEAQKVKDGSCAVLTDQEGFDIVLKYYGIDKEDTGLKKKVISLDELLL